jgi:chromate transporter
MHDWPKDETEVMGEAPPLQASESFSESRRVSLGELALFFLRLGTTAFGGPAAHIAMMEDELVRRRKWLSREKFLDLLGASNLIPGPSSSELAIHIGYLLCGWRGLLVAGFCFILPAAVMVGMLAWAYVRFGKLPPGAGVLYGIKPVVIAVILQALWGLVRTAVKTTFLAIVGVLCVALAFVNVHPLLLLLFGGGIACVASLKARHQWTSAFSFRAREIGGLAGAATSFGLSSLFLEFLKIGAIVFGSGYVLLAFLRADLVVNRGWLTDAQLIDAVAVGQVTPGPVFTTATFIGFILGGIRGAVVSTVGIFLLAFLLVAVSAPLVPLIRKSKPASAFLDGVNAASLALMAAVSWQLGRASVVDVVTVVLAVVSLIALLRFRLNSAWLVMLGAIVGLIANTFHVSR